MNGGAQADEEEPQPAGGLRTTGRQSSSSPASGLLGVLAKEVGSRRAHLEPDDAGLAKTAAMDEEAMAGYPTGL